MNFNLLSPWAEWLVVTFLGKRSIRAKIDPGASITVIGIDNAEQLGLTRRFIEKQNYIRYVGIDRKKICYAFKVPCSSVPLGDNRIACNFIYVPFELIKSGRSLKPSFAPKSHYIIGTDLLNNFNMSVSFLGTSCILELNEHGWSIPTVQRKEYSFAHLHL